MNAVRKLTLTGLLSVCAIIGALALASAPAVAALKVTYQRQLTGFAQLEADSVAVNDSSGDVYVADSSGSGSIREYSVLGLHLSTWAGANTPAGSFGGRLAVSVNNASGEVYVTDKEHQVVDTFNAEGEYLSQFDGSQTPKHAFGSRLEGAVVDQASGDVYVPDPGQEAVDVFDAAGTYISQIPAFTPGGLEASMGVSVAVDDLSGDVYVAESMRLGGIVYQYDAAGELIATWRGFNTPVGFGALVTVAVDQATGDVLVGTSSNSANHEEVAPSVIDVFDSAGDYLSPQITGTSGGPFPYGGTGGEGHGHFGLAVDAATGQLYVADQNEEAVDVFSSMVIPGVLTGPASNLQPDGTALTLNGTVNPDGVRVSNCEFEYGTEAGSYPGKIECADTAQIGEGHAGVPVGAAVAGLAPDTLYHLRLAATNANATNTSPDATFFTSTTPLIEAGSVADVGSADASLDAQIDAAGLSTGYRVEYGPATEAGYGNSTQEAGLGDSETYLPVTEHLSGLQAGTEYRYRFVATNALGTVYGAPGTFKTFAFAGASSSALPDGRAFELVTSSNEDNDAYVPNAENGTGESLDTNRPVVAAEDGASLAYIGDAAPGGDGAVGNGFGNQFLGTRAPGGNWASKVITPAGVIARTGTYLGLSSDLSTGILSTFPEYPLTPDASTRCKTLYAYSAQDGSYRALFNKTKNPEEHCSGAVFAGVSTDGSHIAFEMPAALTADAPGNQEPDLYDSTDGALNVVNVLPDGTPAANAVFGSPNEAFKSHVVSADGSRMFWTDLNNGNLYVREHGGTPQASTVLVSEGGEYLTASNDGALVFFTKGGDLYSFDVDTQQTSDLAPGAELQGVLGTSADGAFVYFVGKGALHGPGAAALSNDRGETPQAGEENLYLSHDGELRFIRTLAEGDITDWQHPVYQEGFGGSGAETAATAETAPSGAGAIFESARNLTGYDSHGVTEVYVFQYGSGDVYCASCNPTGQAPNSGGSLSSPSDHTQLPHWINEDGSEVFFESADPLIPQETAGKREVYEWERQGAGGCQQGEGCLNLLSAGAVSQESRFLDASASGTDVFFTTRAQLLPTDVSDNTVIYDAHVGAKPLTPPLCTGSGCQGVPPAPPIFATPSSVTFEGVGNFAPPAPSKAKPKAKSKPAKCKRGFVKKRGKCVKQSKSKRKVVKSGKHAKKGSK
jgi:hypothetical protein